MSNFSRVKNHSNSVFSKKHLFRKIKRKYPRTLGINNRINRLCTRPHNYWQVRKSRMFVLHRTIKSKLMVNNLGTQSLRTVLTVPVLYHMQHSTEPDHSAQGLQPGFVKTNTTNLSKAQVLPGKYLFSVFSNLPAGTLDND